MNDDYKTGFLAGVAHERHRILLRLLPVEEGDAPLLEMVRCDCQKKWLSGAELRKFIEGSDPIE